MKFCLSSRQTPEYLKKADQIRVIIQDYKQIYDLLEEYPNKDIILNFAPATQDQKILNDLSILGQNRIVLSIFNIDDIKLAKELKFKYYLAQALQTPEEVRAAKNLGVSWVLIDNYAMHKLHEIKVIGIPIRAIPNLSFLDGIPRENGVCGNWIRPEDIDNYSLYIDVIEFGTQPQKREQTLYRLYAEDKKWAGELGRIVMDLDYPALNRTIDSEKIMRRMNCGMTCASLGDCTLCYDILKMSFLLPIYENKKQELNNDSNN